MRKTSLRSSERPQSSRYYLGRLSRCSNLESIVYLHSIIYPDGDVPISFSKAAFERLLDIATAQSEQPASLHDDHVQDITAFLQHELNHDLAGNLEAYYAWFKDKTLPQSAFVSFYNILCDKITLANIPLVEVQSVVKRLSASLTTHLPKGDQDDLLLAAYQSLSTTIHGRLPLYSKANERYQTCTALLEGLSNLNPSRDAAHLILQTYSALSPSSRGSAVPLISQCLSQWLRRLGRHSDFPLNAAESLDTPLMHILNSLDLRQAENIILNTTTHFMTDESLGWHRRSEIILYWLYLLRRSPSLQDQAWDSTIWSQVYSLLSNHLFPDDLHPHFVALGPEDSARVILRYWIAPTIPSGGRLRRVEALSKAQDEAADAGMAVSYTVLHSNRHSRPAVTSSGQGTQAPALALLSEDAPSTIDSPSDIVARLRAGLEARLSSYTQNNTDSIYGPFASLVTTLQGNKIPHDYALDETMRLLLCYESPKRLYNYTMSLHAKHVFIPPGIALKLIHLFLETKHTGFALRTFQTCKTVWPSLCPDLIFALIDNGPVSSTTLFEILNRSEFSSQLPLHLRAQNTNTLSMQRVQLIHNMMFALATSPHLTHRQAFRRVHDCLRYLLDRKAPLSSLVSRALVQAGVVRPLQEKKWVSTEKFNWILRFVRECEGASVADELDEAVFAWRMVQADESKRGRERERLEEWVQEGRRETWAWRRELGHASHRWKRRTGRWRPWLMT